ncbi:MAG: MotA/TolQ/ExbB proton channel family protein [Pseudomonadales bacterium]|nr:MotA/TolQ/ExbB proton channel family protein [Pseudomonadales bacterium]
MSLDTQSLIKGNAWLVDVAGLVIAAVLVHLVYVLFIDPAALELVTSAEAEGTVPERMLVIIFKDLEQEICLILTIWCCWLWFFRYRIFQNEERFLDADFLGISDIVTLDDATIDSLKKRLDEASRQLSSPQLLYCVELALDRLRMNKDLEDAANAALDACSLHLEMLNSKLSFNRYIIYAIPSIGFIGTVRGIGEALGKAVEAMEGDITGVAMSLGLAFNSTFVALLLSLGLMLLSSWLQGREERLVARYKHYVTSSLIPRLNVAASADGSNKVVEPHEPAT